MQQSASNNLINFFAAYFPHGLQLLLVGIDDADVAIIQRVLPYPYYRMSKCHTVACAFDLLMRPPPHKFDLVISDASLPDMDGFLFMRDQHSRTNIPHVVICGVETSGDEIAKAFRYGACFVLWKPLRGEFELSNLWQHACRRREQHLTSENNSNNHDSNNVVNDNASEDHVEGSSSKRQRIVWTKELHQRFLNAVDRLGGPENAQPKAILILMNEPSLTREHVGSHLQKYRENLKKNQEKQNVNVVPTHQIHPFDLAETSYGRFENNTPNPLPQNPNNLQLQEPASMINYPLHPLSHFTMEDVDLWSQHHYHQLEHHIMQMQLSEHGHVLPHSIPSSLIRNGSNNQTSGMSQLDLASGSSYGSHMQPFDQSQSPSTSFRRNMQQPQTIAQNLDSHMQQSYHSPVLGSSNVAATGVVNDGIVNHNVALMGNGSNNLTSSSSFARNMQKLNQSQSPGMQQPQIINQNLNSHMQQPYQSPVSGSSNVAAAGVVNDGIVNHNVALMGNGSNNLTSSSSFARNMQQLNQSQSPGMQQPQIINQNLNSHVQQLDQIPVSGSSHVADEIINQNQASGTSSLTANGSNNLTSGMRQLDLASGSSYGSNMQQFDQSQSPSTSFRRNMQEPQTISQNLTSNVAAIGGVNDGIVNHNPAPGTSSLMGNGSNNLTSNSSFGSNMQQLNQSHSPGMQQPQILNQNLNSHMQQSDQNPVSSSSHAAATGGVNDGIINQNQAPGTSSLTGNGNNNMTSGMK